MQANLVGGAISKQTKTWLPDFLRENFAKPLGIDRYYLPMMPTGDAYMGGGVYILPRDFLKLSQLMLNKGKWNGKEIITEDYVRKSMEARYTLGTAKYGYLWWMIEYPFQGRKVKAYFAGGNGGQISMFIPELDIAFVAFGGNYASSATFKMQQEFFPNYVLPAVAN
jgi:CubicO group peptidase (beta-lactamase class C family)